MPVNNNFIAIDNMFGGVTTIILTNVNVTLLSSQAQSSVIRLTGTLTGNVNIVMASIFKGLRFDNQLLNSLSSFAAFAATAGSSYFAGIPPGVNDMFYDGTKIDYANLGNVGEYWDCATATVPSWVGLSTKPPYLLCNGQTFSSAAYPVLANTLGSTTVPDARGRVRMMSNLGTNRVTVFNGDTLYLGGGDQQVQAHTHTGSGTTSDVSADHTHTGSGTVPVSGTTATESVTHTHAVSGTTGFISADHTHAGSGTTSTDSVDHTHTYTRALAAGAQVEFGAVFQTFTSDSPQTSGISQAHTHTYSFTTSGVSANHTHTFSASYATQSVLHTHTFSATGAYSFTTSGASNGHTHTYSFTSNSFGTGASLNMQPTYVGGVTMIRAA